MSLYFQPNSVDRQTADGTELSVRLQPDDSQGFRDDHALDLVKWGRNTLEDLKALESGRTTSGLVRDHPTNDAPEDTRWRTEVEGSVLGVDVATLAEELLVLELVAVERS